MKEDAQKVSDEVNKEKKQLDVSNQETLINWAAAYNYSYVTKTGAYLVFVLS